LARWIFSTHRWWVDTHIAGNSSYYFYCQVAGFISLKILKNMTNQVLKKDMKSGVSPIVAAVADVVDKVLA